MNDIEKLDALGREYGIVIYNVLQRNAGWGVQWYEGDSMPVTDSDLMRKVVVYDYYPTIAQMVEAETQRIKALIVPKESMPIPAFPV